MCYFCEGSRPQYDLYRSRMTDLRKGGTDVQTLIASARLADELRFETSPEWAEDITGQVGLSIFQNPDPDRGLLLFFLACWLDLQAPYTRVWTTHLAQAHEWLSSNAWHQPEVGIPRGGFSLTRPHLLKTVSILSNNYRQSLSAWFAESVLTIVSSHGPRPGNLYRFVSKVCEDLYVASSQYFKMVMADGRLPVDYVGQHYKRLWMLIMFLRRDQLAVRCLVTRALLTTPEGKEALACWIDDLYFDPNDCELPVDSRVMANWNGLGLSESPRRTVELVAMAARTVARQNGVAPASFDGILFVG